MEFLTGPVCNQTVWRSVPWQTWWCSPWWRSLCWTWPRWSPSVSGGVSRPGGSRWDCLPPSLALRWHPDYEPGSCSESSADNWNRGNGFYLYLNWLVFQALPLYGEDVVCLPQSVEENGSVRGNVWAFVFLVTPVPVFVVPCPDPDGEDQLLQVRWNCLLLLQLLEHFLGFLNGRAVVRVNGSLQDSGSQNPSNGKIEKLLS